MNKENEIAAMYINCQIEGIDISKNTCKKIYELVIEQNIPYEEALKLVDEQ